MQFYGCYPILFLSWHEICCLIFLYGFVTLEIADVCGRRSLIWLVLFYFKNLYMGFCMKIIRGIFFLLSVSFFSIVAVAAGFDGVNAGAAFDLKSTTAEIEFNGTNFNGVGRQSVNAHIEGSYGFVAGDKIIVSVGATYDLFDTELLSISDGGNSAKLKETNHFSLFVAPGYRVSDNALIYGKLGYHHSNIKSSYSAGGEDNINESVHGLGYGLGAKVALNKELYFSVEALRVDYKSITILGGPKGTTGTTIGSFGLGYMF